LLMAATYVYGTLSKLSRGFLLVTHGAWIEFYVK
jgi:hypothetical protein